MFLYKTVVPLCYCCCAVAIVHVPNYCHADCLALDGDASPVRVTDVSMCGHTSWMISCKAENSSYWNLSSYIIWCA